MSGLGQGRWRGYASAIGLVYAIMGITYAVVRAFAFVREIWGDRGVNMVIILAVIPAIACFLVWLVDSTRID